MPRWLARQGRSRGRWRWRERGFGGRRHDRCVRRRGRRRCNSRSVRSHVRRAVLCARCVLVCLLALRMRMRTGELELCSRRRQRRDLVPLLAQVGALHVTERRFGLHTPHQLDRCRANDVANRVRQHKIEPASHLGAVRLQAAPCGLPGEGRWGRRRSPAMFRTSEEACSTRGANRWLAVC
eukprot:186471-Chlamydomonas_euryale.AAC.1